MRVHSSSKPVNSGFALFILAALCLLSSADAHVRLNKDTEHFREESEDSVGPNLMENLHRYEVVFPKKLSGPDFHSNHFTLKSEGKHAHRISVELSAFEQTHRLSIFQNTHLMHPNLTVMDGMGSNEPVRQELCFYQGHVNDKRSNWAAIRTCHGGLQGTFIVDEEEYYIEPAGEHIQHLKGNSQYKAKEAHIVYRARDVKYHPAGAATSQSMSDVAEDLKSNGILKKSQTEAPSARHMGTKDTIVSHTYTLDIFVVLSNALYRALSYSSRRSPPYMTLNEQIAQFLDLYNTVDVIYQQANLGVHIRVSTLLIPSSGRLYLDEGQTVQIEAYYRLWRDANNVPDHDYGFQFMMQSSGTDFVGYSSRSLCDSDRPSGNCHFQAVAQGSSTIRPTTNEWAFMAKIAAHELGHAFNNLQHVGEGSCSGTSPNSNYIMNVGTSSALSNSWAQCSLDHMRAALSSSSGACLAARSDLAAICGVGYYDAGAPVIVADSGLGGTVGGLSTSDLKAARCTGCDLSCLACSGGSASNCTRCSGTRGLLDGSCYDTCPLGYFKDFEPADAYILQWYDKTGYACYPCQSISCGSGFSVSCTTASDAVCVSSGPAVVDCPLDVYVLVRKTDAGGVATWVPPTASSGTATITHTGGDSNTTFPVGDTSIVYTISDGGQSTTCEFKVIVSQDTTPPAVENCPANQNLTLAAGAATAEWPGMVIPTANDNLDGYLAQDSSSTFPAQYAFIGARFPPGVWSFNWVWKDMSENTASCSYVITVMDNEKPVLSACPANQNIAAAGVSSVTATWTAPTATDNSKNVSVTSNKSPGDTFPSGATVVQYTATDSSQNTATCSFTVTVTSNLPPVLQDCPTSRNVVLGAAGTVTVPWTVTAVDPEGVVLTVTKSSSPTFDLSSGPNYVFSSVGSWTITYSFSDNVNAAVTCVFTVTVADTAPPTISGCPADITRTLSPGGSVVTWVPPTATDNVGVSSFVSTLPSGHTFQQGSTSVTYTATDTSNNQATCTFKVVVNADTPPAVTSCPTNDTIFVDSNGHASAVWTKPSAMDAEDGALAATFAAVPSAGVSLSSTSGTFSSLGTFVITYTFTDSGGDSATCSFSVVVRDNIAPTFSFCPSPVTSSANALGGAQVGWAAATAVDNVDSSITVVGPISTPPLIGSAPWTFPKGSYNVQYTATDSSGNTATCSIGVNVIDDSPPKVSGCPSDISVNSATTTASVSWTAPTASDNIDGALAPVAPVMSPNTTLATSGPYVFSAGVHAISYTFSDSSGNTALCSFTVSVSDRTPPVIHGCPSTQYASINDEGEAHLNWTPPTAIDGVDGALSTPSPTSPTTTLAATGPWTFVTAQSFTINYVFTDASGNSATCSFVAEIQAYLTCADNPCGADAVCKNADSTGGGDVAYRCYNNIYRVYATEATTPATYGGRTWEPDNWYLKAGVASTVSRTRSSVSDEADASMVPLYKSERWWGQSYEDFVAYDQFKAECRGDYIVRMYFTETWVNAAGARVFNVTLNGQNAGKVDIFAATGARFSTHVVDFTVSVAEAQGALSIGFLRAAENPKLNGMEIFYDNSTNQTEACQASIQIANQDAASGCSEYFINGGATKYCDGTWQEGNTCSGQTYEIDRPYAVVGSGLYYSVTSQNPHLAQANTDKDLLFSTHAWAFGGDLSYSFPVNCTGNYNIELGWSEISHTSAGARVFGVAIENVVKESALDIFQIAGGANTAVIKTYTASVSDGAVSIRFTRNVGLPFVSYMKITHESSSESEGANQSNIGIVVGAIAVTILVIVAIVAVLVVKRRKGRAHIDRLHESSVSVAPQPPVLDAPPQAPRGATAAYEEERESDSDSGPSAPSHAPARLPQGWEEHLDPERNLPYFYNVDTQQSQWVRPTADTSSRPAPTHSPK